MSTAVRDGYPGLEFAGGGELRNGTMEQALYWQQLYLEIVAIEAKATEVIQDLTAKQALMMRAGTN